MPAPVSEILTPALLRGLRERAAGHDRENSFAHEDLAALREAGYLTAMLPAELGGRDWGFAEAVAAQRLVAAHAPGTALAVNMHLVWLGVDRLLRARGDERLARMRGWAAEGEVLAFGVSEPGNDAVLFDSFTEARRREDGDYELTGAKIFTSLSAAWTRLGVFGKEGEGEDARLVHGFVQRQPGVEVLPNWDALGMRASASNGTKLDKALLRAEDVHSILGVGEASDPLIFGIFASFLTLTGSVYAGVADRAVQLAAGNLTLRRSRATRESLAQDPALRWRVAEAGMSQLALDAQARQLASDLDADADHGASWFPRLVTFRTQAGDTARELIMEALKVSGGSEFSRGTELERLYRDVLASLYHPSDAESAHRTVADWLLGPLAQA
ncbi:acyl-CoA dehydrogenase family protein [Galactobacter valiniphilus]|uniref:acyl-CoA dehydrogenase family protein n=1 Tax=Galactobacter valiniphilus TaxID=2676122 RepID=UPI003735E0DE